jgi:hypothetical protein
MEKLKNKVINITPNKVLVSIFIIALILKITGLTFISTLSWWLIFSPIFVMILFNIVKEVKIEVSLEKDNDKK